MEDNDKLKGLKERALRISQARAPKSITPDLVGGTLSGIIEEIEALRGDEGMHGEEYLPGRAEIVVAEELRADTDYLTVVEAQTYGRWRASGLPRLGDVVRLTSQADGSISCEMTVAGWEVTLDEGRFSSAEGKLAGFVGEEWRIFGFTCDAASGAETGDLAPGMYEFRSVPYDAEQAGSARALSVSGHFYVDKTDFGARMNRLAYSEIERLDGEIFAVMVTDGQDEMVGEYVRGSGLINVNDGDRVVAYNVINRGSSVEVNRIGEMRLSQREAFADLWDTVCAGYGAYDAEGAPDAAHPYRLNGLYLSYAEALTSYSRYSRNINQQEAYANSTARTNIPIPMQWSGTYTRYAQQAVNLEVAVIPRVQLGSLAQAFYGCSNLRRCEIRAAVSVTSVDGAFTGCPKLETLFFTGLASNLNLASCPLLTLESFAHIISKRSGTTPITLTVHKNVFAKLTGDVENDAVGNLSPDEVERWMRLNEDAVAKNIQFITA